MSVRTPKANRFDGATFHAALDSARTIRDISWREMARETGVSASTLSRMASGEHLPDVNSIAALLSWLGMEFEMFINTGRPVRKVEPLTRIAMLLENDPCLTPKAVAALKTMLVEVYKFLRTEA